MTRKEAPMSYLYFELLNKASYVAGQTSVTLDTLGYAHGGKGAAAASFLWNVGAWTSGIWTPQLMESDYFVGPFTNVDPMRVKYYVNGHVQVTTPTVASASDQNKIYTVSYVDGLKRYVQLFVGGSGSCVFGMLGVLEALLETQDYAYTNREPIASFGGSGGGWTTPFFYDEHGNKVTQ